MCTLKPTLVWTLLFLTTAWVVNAGLYVINPLKGSACQASQPCTVTWLDDGRAPLLTSIGVSTVGLYTGFQQLVQSIPPVNVATERSLTFMPIADAGPNSDDYYISFASTTLKVNGSTYKAYSPFFRLTDMRGSFKSPLPSAISSKSIPSSLTQTQSSSATPTITVGRLLTTPTPQWSSTRSATTSTSSTSSSISRFTTSFSSSPLSSPSSSSSPSPLSSPSSPSPPSFPTPSSPAALSGTVALTTNPAILLPSSLLISTLLSWFLRMLYS